MRVLVTGATGALGTAVVSRLVRAGAEVRAMARRPPARLASGVEFFPADIRDLDAVHAATAGVDVVAHLAWVVTSGVGPEEAHAVNLDGTANVLEAMAAHGVGRLVFSSSVTAYGSCADHPQPFTEDEPLRPHPTFVYGSDKKRAEEMILAGGLDAVVARVGPVAGRGLEGIVTRVFGGPSLLAVKGDDVRWQFVHDEDVGRFLADACLGARTGVVNVAADDALSLDEVGVLMGKRVTKLSIGNFERMLRLTMRLGLGEMDPAGFNGVRYLPLADTARLKESWGFRCAWSGADTIVDLARTMSRVLYLGPARLAKPTRLPWLAPSGARRAGAGRVAARREAADLEREVARLALGPAALADRSNEQLEARASLLDDLVRQGRSALSVASGRTHHRIGDAVAALVLEQQRTLQASGATPNLST